MSHVARRKQQGMEAAPRTGGNGLPNKKSEPKSVLAGWFQCRICLGVVKRENKCRCKGADPQVQLTMQTESASPSCSSNEDPPCAPPVPGVFTERPSIPSTVSQVAPRRTSNGSTNSIQFVTVIVPLTRLPENVIKSANPHIALPIALSQLQSSDFADSASEPSKFVEVTPHSKPKPPEQPFFKSSQPSRSSKKLYKRPLCVFCGKVFTKCNTYFKDHLRSHIHEAPFECPHCGKGFSKQHSYKGHIRRSCPERFTEKRHSCPVCQKSFRTKDSVQQHLKLHSSQRKLHRCSRCPATFKSCTGLRSHRKAKHEEERHECEECGQLLTHPSDLRRHMLRHRNIKAHSCLFCNKAFITNQELFRHLRGHTQEERKLGEHSCTFCGKKFRSERYLYNHLCWHIREKWHSCAYCGNQFPSKHAALHHISRYHKQG